MNKKLIFWTILCTVILVLSACQPIAPTGEIEEGSNQTEEVDLSGEEGLSEEEEVTEATAISEELPENTLLEGGTLVFSSEEEPDTLDLHHSSLAATSGVGQYFGASLISRDPMTGDFVPWLAESWSASEDGMSWEFNLRQDVKFHDSTPLTAQDYAFTINRALAPETMSPTTGTLLMGVSGAEALDDYTLQIVMQYPNYSFLDGLSTSWLQPMPQKAIEENPDEYATHPIGVGPYVFQEWVRGDHISLTRNPEYTWAPAWAEGIPPYIETIKFRYIAEYATSVAGLEAGELDVADVHVNDLEIIGERGEFDIIEAVSQGAYNIIYMNLSKEPFTDLKVRQALNMAVNPDVFIQVLAKGYGEPQYGPLSPSVQGYWDGVKEIGYSYDLEQAKTLLAEAGWIDSDGDGILDKDGQSMSFDFLIGDYQDIRIAEILQQQLKEIGIQINIVSLELAFLMESLATGNYDLGIMGIGWSNAQLLWAMFDTNLIGYYNLSQYSNPEMDAILEQILFATTQEAFLDASREAQKYIVENALVIPTYTSVYFTAVSTRVQGYVVSPINSAIYFNNAYIEDEE